MASSGKPAVVLVGRRPAWCENLSLCYLRSALEKADFAVETRYLNWLSYIIIL
jgi:hypothetical protein